MKIPAPCLVSLFFLLLCNPGISAMSTSYSDGQNIEQDSVLRHVVLFRFKTGTSAEDIARIERAFVYLKSKIPEIVSLEWGVNNSPEGLDKGYTHCFFLTFRNEADRNTYLPHPDHKAFGELLGPFLEDVLVIDYWTR